MAIINGTEGADNLLGTAADDTINGLGGNDDALNGADGNDIVNGGDGDDIIAGGLGSDTLDGGAGIDAANYGLEPQTAGVTVNLATGVVGGQAAGDTLIGIENVIGTNFNDVLIGDAGPNFFHGGEGDDSLSGGDGDDVLTGGPGADTIDGGAGNDGVAYDLEVLASGVIVNLQTGVTGGAAAGDTLTNIEFLRGTNFADTLTGNAGANDLVGLDGADTLSGGDGNDFLVGGAGADALDGGAGFDIANYWNSTAAVSINLATGFVSGGDAAGDTFAGIEGLYGTAFGDALTGDAGDNTLWGLDGGDTLDGGDGNDSLQGHAGLDTLIGGAGADALDGGDGIDWATYSASAAGVTIDLAAGTGTGGDAEGDTFASIENLTGSAVADLLIGDGNANAFDGGAGNDILAGGAGADVLDGGAGTDTARYNVSGAAVTVDLGAGTGTGGDAQGDVLSNIENLGGSAFDDTLTGNAGANLVAGGGGDDTLAGAAGNDTLLGGNGTDGLDGGDGWDTLEGEAGDDQLTGGAGGDILRGGAGADHLAGGADYDTASYWDSAVGVTINLQTGVNTGGTAQGDTIATDIETINGSNHDDVMTGDALGNTFLGFDGADTLSGGGGGDILRGGAGADTLNGGSSNDLFSYTAVSDSTAAAADTIQDFLSGTDLISVRMIDADGNAANGDTAFSFIGTAAFSGTAGQLRYEVGDGTTTVSADVNGDSTADFVIHLTGAITLQASDFLL